MRRSTVYWNSYLGASYRVILCFTLRECRNKYGTPSNTKICNHSNQEIYAIAPRPPQKSLRWTFNDPLWTRKLICLCQLKETYIRMWGRYLSHTFRYWECLLIIYYRQSTTKPFYLCSHKVGLRLENN